MMPRKAGYWCNLASFAALMAANLATTALPFGVRRTGELRDGLHALLTPAGYTFSVWLLIYGLLTGWVLYPLLRPAREPFSVPPMPVRFLLTCLLSIVRVMLGDHYPLLNLVILLLLVIVAASMYRSTRQILRPAAAEVWFVRLPFSLYFGWISFTALASIDTWVVQTRLLEGRLSGGPWQIGFTLLLLAVGLAGACLVSYRLRDAIVPLTFAWGYGAIAAETQLHRTVGFVSGAGALALIVYALWICFIRSYERD
ncbi:MAG: hypothetical protein E6Y08_23380 [Paenibacillus sp.]|uniref:hypothetical protein n=1 Tax=Paenibacillus sp. TaxID=58172 RepID=UPI00290FD1BC|nr:hypothetical protein [Paenibacillus sp.]MDU4698755.1 hypothetical protein [Paenibacillus sp.]